MRCVYLLCIFVFPSISASYIKGFAGITEEINGTIDVTPTLNLERIGNKYYYFGAVFKGNYFQAMQFCNLHHMSLVSIETKEESEFLLQRLKAFFGYGDRKLWSSGTSLPDDQWWVWMSTGKPIIYTNWLPNQPDSAGKNERCLELIFASNLMWNDVSCDATNLAICEVSITKDYSILLSSVHSCNLTLIN